jgi:hypothetical protein
MRWAADRTPPERVSPILHRQAARQAPVRMKPLKLPAKAEFAFQVQPLHLDRGAFSLTAASASRLRGPCISRKDLHWSDTSLAPN